MNNDSERCNYLFYKLEKEAKAKKKDISLDQVNPCDLLGNSEIEDYTAGSGTPR